MDCNDYCDLLEMELKCDLLLNVNSNMTELLLSLLIDSHFFMVCFVQIKSSSRELPVSNKEQQQHKYIFCHLLTFYRCLFYWKVNYYRNVKHGCIQCTSELRRKVFKGYEIINCLPKYLYKSKCQCGNINVRS